MSLYYKTKTVSFNLGGTDAQPISKAYLSTSLVDFTTGVLTGVNYTVPMVWTFQNEGTNVLYAQLEDLAGNKSPILSGTVIIDLTNPIISGLVPIDGALLTGVPLISGWLYDNNSKINSSTIQVFVDNTLYPSTIFSQSTFITGFYTTPNGIQDGSHQAFILASDNAGNQIKKDFSFTLLSGVPSTPTNLVTNGMYNAITLGWDKNTDNNFAYYQIQAARDVAAQNWTQLCTINDTAVANQSTQSKANFFVHAKLEAENVIKSGVTINYRVNAVNIVGTPSPWSNISTATSKVIDSGDLAANSIYANNIVAGQINTKLLQTGELSANTIQAGTLDAGKVTVSGTNSSVIINGAGITINNGTLSASSVKLSSFVTNVKTNLQIQKLVGYNYYYSNPRVAETFNVVSTGVYNPYGHSILYWNLPDTQYGTTSIDINDKIQINKSPASVAKFTSNIQSLRSGVGCCSTYFYDQSIPAYRDMDYLAYYSGTIPKLYLDTYYYSGTFPSHINSKPSYNIGSVNVGTFWNSNTSLVSIYRPTVLCTSGNFDQNIIVFISGTNSTNVQFGFTQFNRSGNYIPTTSYWGSNNILNGVIPYSPSACYDNNNNIHLFYNDTSYWPTTTNAHIWYWWKFSFTQGAGVTPIASGFPITSGWPYTSPTGAFLTSIDFPDQYNYPSGPPKVICDKTNILHVFFDSTNNYNNSAHTRIYYMQMDTNGKILIMPTILHDLPFYSNVISFSYDNVHDEILACYTLSNELDVNNTNSQAIFDDFNNGIYTETFTIKRFTNSDLRAIVQIIQN